MKIESKPGIFPSKNKKNEGGFSLIEVIIALLILIVVTLGVFATFTFATLYNRGNSQRSQALSIFQKEIESLRSKKFTPTIMDSDLTGGIKPPKTVAGADGFSYLVNVTVDDDPSINGTQTDNSKTLKEITITVTPQSVTGSWVLAYKTKVVFRRVRAN